MVGLLLCDWLRSIENEPPGTVLTKEEQKVLNLVKELLAEADISVDDGQRLSAATLNIWAGTFDDVWVWGRAYPHLHSLLIIVSPVLAKVLRRFAEEIQETVHLDRGNLRMGSISSVNLPLAVSYLAS
jgi:hypothetical protein